MKKNPTINVWEEKLNRAAHPGVYSILKKIAERGPVVRIPKVGLVVSDASIMREVLTQTSRFTKIGKGGPAGLWTPITGPTALVNMDGMNHTNLRRKIGPLFAPRIVNGLASSMMDKPLEDMLVRLNDGQTVDIVEEVTRIAGTMICELTGLDASDESIFESVKQAKELTKQASLRGKMSDKQISYAKNVLAKLTDSVSKAYDIGDEATVPGKLKAMGLTVDEAMGVSSAFIIAGTETVISYIPRMVALMIESRWDQKLLENPNRMNDVIMEGLRVTVPTPAMMRVVQEDSVVGGRKVKAGRKLILLTLFATRNATQGGAFDPDREIPADIKNIWFGAGSHFCIGMPLAMAQVKEMLDALLRSINDGSSLEITQRKAHKNVFAASYEKLEIRKVVKVDR